QRARRAGFLDNRAHAEGNGDGTNKDFEHIARLCGKALRTQAVEVDIALTQLQTVLSKHAIEIAAHGGKVEAAEEIGCLCRNAANQTRISSSRRCGRGSLHGRST